MILFQSTRSIISFEDDRFKENGRQFKHTYILILVNTYAHFLSINCKFIVIDGNAAK